VSACANSCATGLAKGAPFRLPLAELCPVYGQKVKKINPMDKAHGFPSRSLGSQWWVLNLVGC